MKLKAQIRLGYFFLLSIIIFLVAFSIFFLNRLDKASDRILKENYVSIEAAQNMLSDITSLNEFIFTDTYKREKIFPADIISDFNQNLNICKNNITEPGEKKIVSEIENGFGDYTGLVKSAVNGMSDNTARQQFRILFDKISYLVDINQNASLEKNTESRETFKSAWLYVLIFGTLSLVIAFFIIFKIPSAIIKPLEITTSKISKISEGDYEQRIDTKANNEIGQLALSFNKMAEKLFEYEKLNQVTKIAQRSRLESIVNSLNDPIIVFDEQNNFVLLNTKAELLLGKSNEELKGISAYELSVQNNIIRDILKFFNIGKVLPGNTDDNKEHYLKITRNEKDEYYLVDITNVYDTEKRSGKNSLGYIAALKDVTSFKELNDAKTNFIAALSHELRTPLSAIRLSTNLLQNEKVGMLNPSQEKLVTSVKEETQRLLRIINELIDISKIETGHIKLNFQLTDPAFIINYSISPFIIQVQEKQINLTKQLQSNLPKIKVDAEKISWVILNLLANAVRFTPEKGSIKIAVEKNEDNLEFILCDSGPGISPENIGKIFNKYFQEPGRVAAEEGLGLGLAICKEIIEAHRGKIWVSSEKGKGSEFHFTIPL